MADVARAALTEWSGSSTNGRTPNIRYFVTKLSIVAMYAFFEGLSQGFEQKSSTTLRDYFVPTPMYHPGFVYLYIGFVYLRFNVWRQQLAGVTYCEHVILAPGY